MVLMAAVYLVMLAALGMQLKLQQEKDVFIFTGRNATRDWIASSDRSIGGL